MCNLFFSCLQNWSCFQTCAEKKSHWKEKELSRWWRTQRVKTGSASDIYLTQVRNVTLGQTQTGFSCQNVLHKCLLPVCNRVKQCELEMNGKEKRKWLNEDNWKVIEMDVPTKSPGGKHGEPLWSWIQGVHSFHTLFSAFCKEGKGSVRNCRISFSPHKRKIS